MPGPTLSTEPGPELQRRLEDLLGAKPVGWTRNTAGYTPAERWVVRLHGGRRAFVKAAANELTAGWLRTEHAVYDALRAPYMPEVLAWQGGELPVLILEDLSTEVWPPPWDGDRVAAVLATLDAVAATEPPAWLRKLEAQRAELRGWEMVEEDPTAFLSLGLCGAAWLERALPALVAASGACQLDGNRLLHVDVRSYNICLRRGEALLVDWNQASIGNPRMDLAFWLPSLAFEGGPQPDQLLPDAGLEAAFTSGYFAAHAGLPQIPDAPGVRGIQLAQLRHALPWAARGLGLPPPS